MVIIVDRDSDDKDNNDDDVDDNATRHLRCI